MGKRGNTRRDNGTSGSHIFLTLREEASGKKQSHNVKSLMKLNHFQKLAQWSSGINKSDEKGSGGCLGAFFGRRFAEYREFLGISPDPSLFPCQRCESILQPGFNCTIRIERNRAKHRRCSKTKTPTQNNIVYTCHFCLHRNLKRGTPKGYMRDLTPSTPKASSSKPKSVNSGAQICVTEEKINFSVGKNDKVNEAPSPAISNVCSSLTDNQMSSLAESGVKLLDSKRRKRKKPGLKGSVDETLVSSAPPDGEKASGTLKRRKKSWNTLKDIANSEERERNERLKNFSIPFIL